MGLEVYPVDPTIKSDRTLKGLDISAKAMDQMLGHNDGYICRHCKAVRNTGLHWSDCVLFKVRPVVLHDAIIEKNEEVRRTANKQIMFRQERKDTVSRQKVNRKISTRPKRKFTTPWEHEL